MKLKSKWQTKKIFIKYKKIKKWIKKSFEVFRSSFHKSKLKSWWPKNMRLKNLTGITPINLWLLKIYFTGFLNEFLLWYFLQNLVYIRLTSKNPQHYRKSRLQWIPFYKILDRKIINIHFQNWIFDAKTRLQKQLSKNMNN